MIRVPDARLECSIKVLGELGLKKEPLGYGDPAVDPFFAWYVHLFHYERKKSLVFVNCRTRYPIIAPFVTRDEIRALNIILAQHLRAALIAEGVTDAVISKFLVHLSSPEISKSNNRSVIRSSAEYERLIFAILENPYHPGGIYTQTEMSLRLARTPILTLKPNHFPYSAFSSEILRRYGETGHFRFDPIAMKPAPLH
jgi:hypothetical protein